MSRKLKIKALLLAAVVAGCGRKRLVCTRS